MKILMKYHALFVIFEKAAKFEIVICCKLKVALYGLRLKIYDRAQHLKYIHAVIFCEIEFIYSD